MRTRFSVWLVGCAALLCAAATPRIAAADVPACALFLDGSDAALWRDGVWRPAGEGLLTDAAAIRTGPDTRAEIRCADGLTLTVGVGTEIAVESLIASARPTRNVVLRLLSGIAAMVAPRPRPGRTEIRGPLAIAAVRSTEWLVIAGPDGATAVFVRAGRVAVAPASGAAAVLRPGEGIDVTPADGPRGVVRWGAPRIAAAGEALGFGWR
jgi:hypothetical protein